MLYSKYCPSNMNFHHNYCSHHHECFHNHLTFFFHFRARSFLQDLPLQHGFFCFSTNSQTSLLIQSEPPKCSCFFSATYKGIFHMCKNHSSFYQKSIQGDLLVLWSICKLLLRAKTVLSNDFKEWIFSDISLFKKDQQSSSEYVLQKLIHMDDINGRK